MTRHASPPALPELIAISNVYSLLSRLWLREVDQALATELNQPPLCEAFAAIGGVIPVLGELDDLAVQYCRWFIGPKHHMPPLQSVWHNGQLQSEITDSIRAFAEAFNYQPSRSQSWGTSAGDMPDHLGVQLDIMAHATRLSSDGDPAQEAREATAEFFHRHLMWTGNLFERLLQRDDSAFYLALAQTTNEFLNSEQAIWGSAMSRKVVDRN